VGAERREVSSNEVHQLMMHRKSPVEGRFCSKNGSFLIRLFLDLMGDEAHERRGVDRSLEFLKLDVYFN
jgi:hypothetical protein